MIKGIIFDLDLTLVDTSTLKSLRDKREWQAVYHRINETTLYPHVLEFLEWAHEKYKMGIVTSGPASYAQRVINHHELDLPILAAYHDTTCHKPHPAPITLGVQKLELQPEEVIAVGDEDRDVLSARAASVVPVIVAWGEGAAGRTAQDGIICISDFLDLQHIVTTQ